MNSKEIDIEKDAYEQYLYALSFGEKKLKEKYPKFYQTFQYKFNNVIKMWLGDNVSSSLSDNDYKDKLFKTYCRLVLREIESDDYYENILIDFEKKGIPRKKPNKHNIKKTTYFYLVNFLFDLPDLIMASFKPGTKSFIKAKKEFDEFHRISSSFQSGNPIEKRKSKVAQKYRKVSLLIKILREEYKKAIKDPIQFACDIVDVDISNYSKWKNDKTIDNVRLNSNKISIWENELTDQEKVELKNEIKNYLNS